MIPKPGGSPETKNKRQWCFEVCMCRWAGQKKGAICLGLLRLHRVRWNCRCCSCMLLRLFCQGVLGSFAPEGSAAIPEIPDKDCEVRVQSMTLAAVCSKSGRPLCCDMRCDVP